MTNIMNEGWYHTPYRYKKGTKGMLQTNHVQNSIS
jgi:hypothetical protein